MSLNSGDLGLDFPEDPIEEQTQEQPTKPIEPDFVDVPVLRGFTDEVATLFHTAAKYNSNIAGGYARYMASPHPEPVPATDVDVFTPNEDAYDSLLVDLKGLGYEKEKITEVYTNLQLPDHALASFFGRTTLTIQVIKPFENEITDLSSTSVLEKVRRFDFSVIRAYVYDETTVKADPDFVSDEEMRNLRIIGIKCPLLSVQRIAKYMAKGYTIDLAEIIKLFKNWQERGPEYQTKTIELLTQMDGQYDFWSKMQEAGLR